MSHRSAVTAIIVTFDSASVLPACLDALQRNGVGVVVVDNASLDDSVGIAASAGAFVVRNQQNQGYGRANNQGVMAATTPWVLIINPDVVLAGDCVPALLGAAERYGDGVVFAPRVTEPDGRVFFQAQSLLAPRHLNRAKKAMVTPEGDVCAPFLSGACMMVRREAFLAHGGFDPNIFLFYEDDDLCRRLGEVGGLIHVDAARAGHIRGASSAPKKGRRFTARWHMAWSHGYMSAKWGLANPAISGFFLNVLKTFGYRLLLKPEMVERHWGSAIGYLAWLRGRSALRRQGLEPGQPGIGGGPHG
jgi:N-acetylglucosaminyl-diphospho-decaprenol L-rhamnosyltransferase